jgi:hypothetical protein
MRIDILVAIIEMNNNGAWLDRNLLQDTINQLARWYSFIII